MIEITGGRLHWENTGKVERRGQERGQVTERVRVRKEKQ